MRNICKRTEVDVVSAISDPNDAIFILALDRIVHVTKPPARRKYESKRNSGTSCSNEIVLEGLQNEKIILVS